MAKFEAGDIVKFNTDIRIVKCKILRLVTTDQDHWTSLDTPNPKHYIFSVLNDNRMSKPFLLHIDSIDETGKLDETFEAQKMFNKDVERLLSEKT